MNILFKYIIGTQLCYQSKTFIYVLHEIINDLKCGYNTNNQFIDIEINDSKKRHSILFDRLSFINYIFVSIHGKKYNILNENDLLSLMSDYECISKEKIIKHIKLSLMNVNLQISEVIEDKNNDKLSLPNKIFNVSKNVCKKDDLNICSSLLKDNNIKLDCIDFDDKSSKSDKSDENDSETYKLTNNIKKLEKLKDIIDTKVEKIETQNDQYIDMIKEKLQQELNIFNSERTYTYPKIFKTFFIDKKITDWDKLPPMFIVKFLIFLYLEGKDLTGIQIRENLLDSKDGFRLFKLLHEYLEQISTDVSNDDKLELPNNENDKKIVEDFISNLPPITSLLTNKHIIEMLNDPNDKLFNEDIDEDDCDELDCDNNKTYNGVV